MASFTSSFAKISQLLVLTVSGICALGFPLCAQELPEVFRQDFPFENTESTPAWLKFSTEESNRFGNLSLQLTPPQSEIHDLLLTLIFHEQPGNFLRVYQTSPTGAQTLADNVMEGIWGTNQRTILLKDLPAREVTNLTLLSGSTTLPVQRLILTWVKPQTVLADARQNNSIALRGSLILRDTDLAGLNATTQTLRFGDNFVSAPLQEKPDDISEGITFVVALDKVPAHVRLTGQLLSPDVTQRLQCRINGRSAPDLTPYVPSLTDPAYLLNASSPLYAGWLPAGIYLPGALWQKGDNLIELRPVDFDGLPSQKSLSLKETLLEILFHPEPISTPDSVPDQTNAIPRG